MNINLSPHSTLRAPIRCDVQFIERGTVKEFRSSICWNNGISVFCQNDRPPLLQFRSFVLDFQFIQRGHPKVDLLRSRLSRSSRRTTYGETSTINPRDYTHGYVARNLSPRFPLLPVQVFYCTIYAPGVSWLVGFLYDVCLVTNEYSLVFNAAKFTKLASCLVFLFNEVFLYYYCSLITTQTSQHEGLSEMPQA